MDLGIKKESWQCPFILNATSSQACVCKPASQMCMEMASKRPLNGSFIQITPAKSKRYVRKLVPPPPWALFPSCSPQKLGASLVSGYRYSFAFALSGKITQRFQRRARGNCAPLRAILWPAGHPMQKHAISAVPLVSASHRWSRSRARCICPRRHLRVLPTRTRPSLFGGD